MSNCCPERHGQSDDVGLYAPLTRRVCDSLVTISYLEPMAETLAVSSTRRVVAGGVLNSRAIRVVKNNSAIIEKRLLRRLQSLGTSSCSYKPPRPGTSTA